jgi:hypothetical protein
MHSDCFLKTAKFPRFPSKATSGWNGNEPGTPRPTPRQRVANCPSAPAQDVRTGQYVPGWYRTVGWNERTSSVARLAESSASITCACEHQHSGRARAGACARMPFTWISSPTIMLGMSLINADSDASVERAAVVRCHTCRLRKPRDRPYARRTIFQEGHAIAHRGVGHLRERTAQASRAPTRTERRWESRAGAPVPTAPDRQALVPEHVACCWLHS